MSRETPADWTPQRLDELARELVELALYIRTIPTPGSMTGWHASGVEMMIAADRWRELQARLAEIPLLPERRPGRPPWTRDRFWQALREARSIYGNEASQEIIAAKGFDVGPGQLRKLMKRFGPPPG